MGGLGRRVRRLLGVAVLAWAAAPGCASIPPGGTVHVLRPGENLYRLSLYYGVPVSSIRRANRLRDVTQLPDGRRLRIPGARKPQPAYALAPPGSQVAARPPAHQPDLRDLALREAELDFAWPLRGRVSSGFGRRWGRPHEGIDIPARRGTMVRAAEAGRVVHSGGNLGAYGRVVIIKHAGRYQTVYAHNRRNLVRKGQFVEKGQAIAEVGSTGNARGPHLHFEIRRARRPQDPLRYLR